MKDFFVDFLTLLANCILIICLCLMSFFLIANLYHLREVSYGYNADLTNNLKYTNYKKSIDKSIKKIESVDYNSSVYSTTAKPIHDYYISCVDSLKKGTFAKFENDNSITALDIYNANNEILNEYNNKCIFYIPYSIDVIYKGKKQNVSFDRIKNFVDERGDMITNNADYLIDSELGNSSYSFVTDTTRASIYNKIGSELNLTINNYEMIAELLDDIADWYVLEFGGNN